MTRDQVLNETKRLLMEAGQRTALALGAIDSDPALADHQLYKVVRLVTEALGGMGILGYIDRMADEADADRLNRAAIAVHGEGQS